MRFQVVLLARFRAFKVRVILLDLRGDFVYLVVDCRVEREFAVYSYFNEVVEFDPGVFGYDSLEGGVFPFDEQGPDSLCVP